MTFDPLHAPHAHCWVIKRYEDRYTKCILTGLCEYCKVSAKYGITFGGTKSYPAKKESTHMPNVLKMSSQGFELVKRFEGKYLKAYKCPANVWTIGYGHTGSVDDVPIKEGMIITDAKCDELLEADMREFEDVVNKLVTVFLTQPQFDALVSFAFNCGAGALKSSTLLRLLNLGNYDAVPTQLLRWNKAGGKVLAGLTRRRQAEAYLWSAGQLKFNF